MRRNLFYICLWVSVSVLLGDSLAKYFARHYAPTHTLAFDPIFHVELHKNMGIIFNIPAHIPLIVIFTLVILGILVSKIYKEWNTSPHTLGLLLICFGAFGNLIDRLLFGYTVDYIIFFHRLAINLADVLIFIGALMLVWFHTQKNVDKKHKT